jgi:DNA (cytosine-5)-methyltransferase 1
VIVSFFMKTQISLMELFAGGGTLGFSLVRGLSEACDVSQISANEIEPRYVRHWASLHPTGDTFCGGVAKFHPSELSRPTQGVTILAAGIPCTGASSAGISKNALSRAEDHLTAGHLFIPTLLYVRRHRPRVVVFENVPNYAKTASATVVREALATAGYSFTEYVLNAFAEFDTPTERKRWVLIATLESSFQWNYSATPHDREIGAYLDPEGVDSDIESPEQVAAHDRYLARKQAEGCGWRKVVLQRGDRRTPTFVRTYHKKHAVGPWVRSGDRYRHLRPREIARLHGFPESFTLPDGKVSAIEILGQGVCYNPFFALGKALGEWIAAGRPNSAQLGQAVLF